MKFNNNNGFNSFEEIIDTFKKHNLNTFNYFRIIQLDDKYYAVGFSAYEKQIVLTKNEIWFTSNGYKKHCSYKEIERVRGELYDINKIKKNIFNETLFSDMESNFKIINAYSCSYNNTKKDFSFYPVDIPNSYYIILGLILAERNYIGLKDKEELKEHINAYYKRKELYIEFLNHNASKIIAIDTFKQMVLLGTEDESYPIPFKVIWKYKGIYKVIDEFTL